MLHTWSLSIEEQFYIFYPFFLLTLCRIKKFNSSFIFLILILISLSYAHYYSNNDQQGSFYSSVSRSWELLSGGLIYFLKKNYNKSKISKLNGLVVNLSFVILILCLCLFNKDITHPSFLTLVPIIVTCVIIYFYNIRIFSIKILSNRVLVGIGKISYSLYLWHYPILSFRYISKDYLTYYDKIIIILITFILALITYVFVEKPFRKSKKLPTKYIIFIYFLLCGFLINGIINKGYVNRTPDIILNSKQKQFKDDFVSYGCNEKHTPFNCKIANEKNLNEIYLIGDSHSSGLAFPLYEEFSNNKWNIHLSTFDNCALIVNFQLSDYSANNTFCNKKFIDARLEYLINSKPGYVVIFETFYSLTEDLNNKEIIAKNFSTITNKLLSAGHKIIIIYPVPKFQYHVPRKIFKIFTDYKKDFESKLDSDLLKLPYKNFKSEFAHVYAELDKLKSSSIIRIYPEDLFCNNQSCLPFSKKEIYYKDDHHLSYLGSKLIVNRISKIIKDETLLISGKEKEIQQKN